jgi:REP element-mobilizing transposase RayT
MSSNIPPLTCGNFYHIYNRGNNRENVFIQERNYAYFMELWWKYTYQIAETYAYCLLKNHFHAAVYIKNQEDLTRDLTGFQNLSGLNANSKIKEPSQYFSNLFNAYTRGVNLATQRTGALFERPFERIPITNDDYFLRLVVYIHQNPQKHRFAEDFREWNYSSYHELVANVPTRLQRDKLMEFFGSRNDFIRIHQETQPLNDLDDDD